MNEAFLQSGGIKLGFLSDTVIEQMSELDESNTDSLCTKIRLSVSSIFNPDSVPAELVLDNSGEFVRRETPAETMKRVREYLLAPRRELIYWPVGVPEGGHDGRGFIHHSGGADEANGPFPESCRVKQLTPETWLIEYVIVIRVRDCEAGGSRGWLSLRWSDTTTYDENWFATRRRTGVLVLSSAGAPGGVPNADAYRGLVTPAVPKGFRRKSAEYSLSENNLKVRFTFIDRELCNPAPTPGLKLTGRMIVTTPLPGGIRIGHLNLKMTGPKGVRKQELVAALMRVAWSRIKASRPANDATTGRIIVGGGVVEDMDDEANAVELIAEWKIKVDQVVSGTFSPADPVKLGGGYDWVGEPLEGSDPSRAIGPRAFGTAEAVGLAAAALGDPCGQEAEAVKEATQNLDTPTDTSLGGATLTVASPSAANYLGTGQGLLSDTDGLYADDGPGTYEVYEITAHYSDDPGTELAPSTKPGGKAKELQFHAGVKTMQLEFSATKLGSPPTIPGKKTGDANVVYLGGTISPGGMDLAADSTTRRYTVSGILRYGFLDSTVVVSAPLPPWLSRSLAAEAGLAASRVDPTMAFPASAGADPFEGTGTTEVIPGDGAGGDWGPTTGDPQGQTIYP